ncbi:hypothetical protein [Bradyrhizobium sp. Ash2021]|uniref:hypothetical protein n=1 Tax=Bradyrhizobium sp. Ash2021 TaxID=2954771 RepID=UPI0028167236|nr:hypothetical protein [Bradyrhizobium sp. Ash2021]WMT75794.1 hypothetical protein NL528_05115 [Bradyrhizobium sp. Ash2021]
MDRQDELRIIRAAYSRQVLAARRGDDPRLDAAQPGLSLPTGILARVNGWLD